MEVALRRSYRLSPRGGPGLSCDDAGVALGGIDLARVRRDADGVSRCEVRPPAEIGHILNTAYGPQSDASVLRLHRGLRRAARWLEAGDLASAGVEAVMLGLPDLALDAITKLAVIADLEKAGNTAWRTEPRLPAGQTGGGQWTTGGGTSVAKPTSSASRPGRGTAWRSRKPGPAHSTAQPAAKPRPRANTARIKVLNAAMAVANAGVVFPARTAAVAGTRPGATSDLALPKLVGRLVGAGAVPAAAELLDLWHDAAEREQVTNAIARFGLDASRPADVMAANAYVWSKYNLPLKTEAPFGGPKLDSASQAVMRFVAANPDAFVAVLRGPPPQAQKALSLLTDAANRGLADASAESRADTQGVDPALQAKSRAARKAIAEQLKFRTMQAHHLVPRYVWMRHADITALAIKAGWDVNDASNLIGLPVDFPTKATLQAEFGLRLPIHNGSHGIYNELTRQAIIREAAKYSGELTPIHARIILDTVANENREAILDGLYDPAIKVLS